MHSTRSRFLLGLVLTLFLFNSLPARNRKCTKWQRLATPHFDIIFRSNIYGGAQEVANALEHYYGPVAKHLGVKPRRMPVILFNRSVGSNAVVQLCPRKMNYHTFPTGNYNFISSSSWSSMLAVHESRHVAQHAKLKRRFNRLWSWLGGDLFLSAIMSLNIPRWFFEGDAVGMETALTNNGRGRVPYFGLLYKVTLLERGGFSYIKQLAGSFKHEVPDNYKLGYYMTTHLRRRYGKHIIADILDKTTWPTSFYWAIKRLTGKSVWEVYKDAHQELKALWEEQLKDLPITPAQRVSPREGSSFTSYAYPHDYQGDIVALKSGIGQTPVFVRINAQQEEKVLCYAGQLFEGTGFSLAQDKLVWTEKVPHPLFQHQSYGVLKCYDFKTRRKRTLTKRSRYGVAALSPEASQIVVLESNEAYQHQLVILDASKGTLIKRLPNPENCFYYTPKWSPDGKCIIATQLNDQKASIVRIHVGTGAVETLCPPSSEHIGHAFQYDHYVLYNSACHGIDNIYALDLHTNQRFRVTSRKYGAYHAAVLKDGTKMLYNDFTKDGLDIVQAPFDPQRWTPIAQVKDHSIHYYQPLVDQEKPTTLGKIATKKYAAKRYYPAFHLLNPHSWSIEPMLMPHAAPMIAIKLMSQDLLDTTTLQASYALDPIHGHQHCRVGIGLKKLYPIIDLQGTHDYRAMLNSIGNRTYNSVERRTSLKLSARAPLHFQVGRYARDFFIKTTCSINNTRTMVPLNQKVLVNSYTKFEQSYHARFMSSATKSLQDMYPTWQQKVDVQYSHMPYTPNTPGRLLYAKLTASFPGLGKHHSLYFKLKHQYNDRFPTWVKSILPKSFRGNKGLGHSKHITGMGVSYAFPIAYPDLPIGRLLLLKRIKANGFYEMARFQPNRYASSLTRHKPYYFQNIGVDLTLDLSPIIMPEKLSFQLGMSPFWKFYKHIKEGQLGCTLFLSGNIQPLFIKIYG